MKGVLLLSLTLPLVVAACDSSSGEAGRAAASDSTEARRAVVRRFYTDVINGGNIGLVDSLVAPGFVDHTPVPGEKQGVEGFKAALTEFKAAFPDLKADVQEIIVEKENVAVRLMLSGTNTGSFMGMPPTGKRFSSLDVDIVRLDHGKATDLWSVMDMAGMMQQLGAAASGAPASADTSTASSGAATSPHRTNHM